MHKAKVRFHTLDDGGLEAYIKQKDGRFYGFCVIRPCDNKKFGYWIDLLMPGSDWWWVHLLNPVGSVKAAKLNAKKLIQHIIDDLQGITTT